MAERRAGLAGAARLLFVIARVLSLAAVAVTGRGLHPDQRPAVGAAWERLGIKRSASISDREDGTG